MDDEYENADSALDEYEDIDDYDQYESDEDLEQEFKKKENKQLERAKELLKLGSEKAKKTASDTGAMAVKIGKGAIEQYKTDLKAKKASPKTAHAGTPSVGLGMFMPSQTYAGEQPGYEGDMFGVGSPQGEYRQPKRMKQKPTGGFGMFESGSGNNDNAMAMIGMGSSRKGNDAAFEMFGMGTKRKGPDPAFGMLGIGTQPRKTRRKPQKRKTAKKKTTKRKKK